MSQPHIFALWCPHLLPKKSHAAGEIEITNKELINRIITILRLRIGEQCILFDSAHHMTCTLSAIRKKSITVTYTTVYSNSPLRPTITALVPILKKDDLSAAIAQITAVGVSAIQLVTTATTQRTWGGDAEYARLERVIIAAAEQAKHYVIPTLHHPVPLSTEIERHTLLLVGDPEGTAYAHTLARLPATIPACAVLVGPEADFTTQEKSSLVQKGARMCALTPTVLRSQLAITLMVAAVRAWYYKKE